MPPQWMPFIRTYALVSIKLRGLDVQELSLPVAYPGGCSGCSSTPLRLRRNAIVIATTVADS